MKSADVVLPATYAKPSASNAMPADSSSPLPQRKPE
jgi:hypothetical protein